MTTWRELILNEMQSQNETWDNVVACTLSNEELDVDFYDGYGSAEGQPFTLWTNSRVYFPVVYDGAEWVGSVPRHPCAEATEHIGGQ